MSQATARILDFPDDFIPEDELLESDGIPLDSSRQRKQINLAIDVIEQAMAEQGADDVYVGGNQFVYTSPDHARTIRQAVEQQLSLPHFPAPVEGSAAPRPAPGKKLNKGPDVFVVRGVEQREREVWASWLEGGRLPEFVFEIQSKSTAHVDADEKRTFYAEVFKSREYFYYGPDDPDLGKHQDVLVGLRLGPRGLYEPIRPDRRGWIWSEVLGLYAGRWDGVYDKRNDRWIRLYDAHGRLIPTGKEEERRLKEEECQLKEEERRLKEEERQRRKVAEEQAKVEYRLRKAAEEKVEEERQRLEEERRRAEEERRRAEAAEAEIARLKKLMESSGR